MATNIIDSGSDAYIDGKLAVNMSTVGTEALEVDGNIVATGTVNGVDVASLENSFDGHVAGGFKTHVDIDTHIDNSDLHFTKDSINHGNLLGIGTYDHSLIDAHIEDTSLHLSEAMIDHANIQNVGSLSHTAIDDQIAITMTHTQDGSIHFTEGSIDHGAIQGLEDDDHQQYVLADGSRDVNGDLKINGDIYEAGKKLESKYLTREELDVGEKQIISFDIPTITMNNQLHNKYWLLDTDPKNYYIWYTHQEVVGSKEVVQLKTTWNSGAAVSPGDYIQINTPTESFIFVASITTETTVGKNYIGKYEDKKDYVDDYYTYYSDPDEGTFLDADHPGTIIKRIPLTIKDKTQYCEIDVYDRDKSWDWWPFFWHWDYDKKYYWGIVDNFRSTADYFLRSIPYACIDDPNNFNDKVEISRTYMDPNTGNNTFIISCNEFGNVTDLTEYVSGLDISQIIQGVDPIPGTPVPEIDPNIVGREGVKVTLLPNDDINTIAAKTFQELSKINVKCKIDEIDSKKIQLATIKNSDILAVTDGDVGITNITLENVGKVAAGLVMDNSNFTIKTTESGNIKIDSCEKIMLNSKNGVYGGETTGSIKPFATKFIQDGWLKCNGAEISRIDYSNLFSKIVPMLSSPSINVNDSLITTVENHNLQTGDPVYFITNGTLPTNIIENTIYYIIYESDNSFYIASTLYNALSETKILMSGSSLGEHSLYYCPFGLGDGSTTFNIPDLRGEFIRGWDDGRSVDINRAFGSYQEDQIRNIDGYFHIYSATSENEVTISGQTGAFTYRTASKECDRGTNGRTGRRGGLIMKTSLLGSSFSGVDHHPRNVSLLYCIKY